MARRRKPKVKSSALDSLLREGGYSDAFIADLKDDEREALVDVLAEQARDGTSDLLSKLRMEDFKEWPVSAREFFTNPYYIGNKILGSIYPRWLEVHDEIEARDAREVVLTGSIGGGKSWNATLHLVYDLYRVSCLKDPHRYYGLAQGSTIAFGLYSVFKYKVGTTVYPVFRSILEDSTYFRERFQVDPNNVNTIRLPNNVIVIHGSSEVNALGENLFSALIDEANFMRGDGAADEAERSQAMQLHNAIRLRQASRFRTPGRLYLISSKKFHSSYTTEYIRQNRGNPKVAVFDFALWDTKPKAFYDGYGGATFRVLVGNAAKMSRLLAPGEQPEHGEQVVEVPEKHRGEFMQDVEQALRDIAGVETVGVRPLITRRDIIGACVDPARKHPFHVEEVDASMGNPSPIEEYLDHASVFSVRSSQYRPKLNPSAMRYMHVDMSLGGDNTGLAMGHVSGLKEVKRSRPDGTSYVERAPFVTIDMLLRIRATRRDQIDLAKIRGFIIALNTYGYAIGAVTFDQFQSADMIQILTKEGISAGHLSVDRTDLPYLNARQALVEGRVSYYHYAPLVDELVNLEHDRDEGKVDHPSYMTTSKGDRVTGSKDVADAFAAVIHHCVTAKVAYHAQVDPASLRAPTPKPVRERHAELMDETDWLTKDYS